VYARRTVTPSTHRTVLAWLSVLAVAGGCEAEGNGHGGPAGSTCGFAVDGDVDSDLGDVRLDALIEASGRFAAAASAMDAQTRAACDAIAADLGADATATDTAEACDQAAERIGAILDDNPDVALSISYLSPSCTSAASAVVDCTAACDASFDAEATPPTCRGGELGGACAADCTGSCLVDGGAGCLGVCDGTCAGTCDGAFEGECVGTCVGLCDACSAPEIDGTCAGTCTGTCRGTCDGDVIGACAGTCEGDCQGGCRVAVEGACDGMCSGECDVDLEAPICDGGHLEVEADADCEAACEADASFTVTCAEPELIVTYAGLASVDEAAIGDLVATLDAHYGAIAAVAARASIVVQATARLATRASGATVAATRLGAQAADCLADALQTIVAASTRVTITVEAEVTVTSAASGG
jgi:hypothetical protein